MFHSVCGLSGIPNFALKGHSPVVYFLPRYLFPAVVAKLSFLDITLSIAPIHEAHPNVCPHKHLSRFFITKHIPRMPAMHREERQKKQDIEPQAKEETTAETEQTYGMKK